VSQLVEQRSSGSIESNAGRAQQFLVDANLIGRLRHDLQARLDLPNYDRVGLGPSADLRLSSCFQHINNYSGGRAITIRPLSVNDIDADLAAKDDEQIDWLWESGQRYLGGDDPS
jgi:hypothetical protein